jgi:ferredoxin
MSLPSLSEIQTSVPLRRLCPCMLRGAICRSNRFLPYRGAQTAVHPSLEKNEQSECVNCSQCARICPTGALTVKSEVEAVWKAFHDPKKWSLRGSTRVRVANGEMFGLEPAQPRQDRLLQLSGPMGFDRASTRHSPRSDRNRGK